MGAAWAGLIAALMGAGMGQVDGASAGARLTAIEAAQKSAAERYHKELLGAGNSETARQPAVDRFLVEVRKNTRSALDLARALPDDPAAFEALKFVIRTNGSGPDVASSKALRMILDRGDTRAAGQGKHLAQVALRLWQFPDAETLLRRVLAENPNRDDRAAACYWLAHHLQTQARVVRRLRETPAGMKIYDRQTGAQPIGDLVRAKDPDALDREAVTLLERAIAEFGDVRMAEYPRTIADFVPGELFAALNLNVGSPAPEIAGSDHRGTLFRLSDERGKVVVLTFSGNWCGPCVEMYSQERSLVAKYKDRPFTLVSVNTDAELETLEDSIARGKITWRCWHDGGTDGPITTRWGVSSFPSIFVLDRRGIIRFKNVRGDELDRAVAALIDEDADR